MQGELEQVGGQWRLRFVRSLPHPPGHVWAALTEPEHLAAWFPSGIEGERTPRARLRFRFPADLVAPIDGEMLVYDPPHVLEFTWGGDTLRLELEPEAAGTRLTLLDTLDELGKAARDAVGWHGCLDALALHLAGRESRSALTTGWREVQAGYVERFGPEASRIGPPEGMDPH